MTTLTKLEETVRTPETARSRPPRWRNARSGGAGAVDATRRQQAVSGWVFLAVPVILFVLFLVMFVVSLVKGQGWI